MPNWCINSLEVVSDEDTRKSILAAVLPDPTDEGRAGDQEAFIFENLLPRPADIGEDWYQWSVDNWGTKWADDSTEITSMSDDDLQFVFSTAWSPPCAGIKTISKNYPDAHFILTWEEGGMCFMGGAVYKDGEVLHEVNIEGDDYPQFDGDFDGDEYQKYADDMCDLRDRIQTELWEVTQ